MALTRIRAQQISDIDYKQAVRVITLSNITLAGGAPNTVDGVSLVAGDRILVAGQSTGSQNGLYDVTTLGTGANGTWARTADGDVTGEIQAGMIVMVTEGDAYKDSQWKLTTNNPIVIGSTALTFEQNSAYAFGNIYANGTAVLANAVGGTVTLTAGDNIAIIGNNTSKTVAIGVTGISLNSISNGTSNVNVVSSGGNVTIGVGGTNNVAIFSSGGLEVTANITSGNLSTSGKLSVIGNTTVANLSITGANIDVGNSRIQNVAEPSAGTDAATKDYVDSVSSSGFTIEDDTANTTVVSGGDTLNLKGTANQVSVDITATDQVTFALTPSISVSGNVTGNYILGNGSQLTGISATSIANGTSNVSILSANANVTITVAGETDSSVFSPGSLFTGITAVPKTLTGNVVMAANCFGAIITGTVITGNLQIPDGTTVYTWTPN